MIAVVIPIPSVLRLPSRACVVVVVCTRGGIALDVVIAVKQDPVAVIVRLVGGHVGDLAVVVLAKIDGILQ